MCARADLNKHGPTAAWLSKILFSDVELEENRGLRPTDPIPVLRIVDGVRRHDCLSWGFVPYDEPELKHGQRYFNARAETAARVAAFRDAMHRRRCVIPVDGFYEWSGLKGKRTKHWIGMADESQPVLLAGLWETFTRGAESLEACTVLTCAPNELLAPIHNRMPLILTSADVDRWLDTAVMAAGVSDLLRPHASELMRVEVAELPEQLDWIAELTAPA